MFGLSLVREKHLSKLIETVSTYERTLEDIGWINMSSDPINNQNALIGEGFHKMLKRVKVYYYNNPLAGHWVHLTTSFVFGEGISKPKAKDEKIQTEVIDPFWDDPDNRLSLSSYIAQQLLCNKVQYEGNLFFIMFDDEVGNVKVRILNTDEVVDIIRSDDDAMRPLFYKVKNNKSKYNFASDSYEMASTDFIYFPDKDITNPEDYGVPKNKLRLDARVYHVKINCDINDKFGVPELYRGIDWMKAHKDMSGDLATLIKALSKFAWKKKVTGTQAQVNTIAGAMRTNASLNNIRNSAGQTQVENQSVDLEAMDIKTGGTDINIKGMREMKLMICAASGLFEHYFGDPSTGNLATAKSMELPMVKKFVNYQSLWSEIYVTIFKYIIGLKISLGILSGSEEEDTKSGRMIYKYSGDDGIDTDFPPILETDLQPLAGALSTAKDKGMITDELAAEIFMLALNVNNIDEEMEDLKAETAQKKAESQKNQLDTIKAQQGVFPGKPGLQESGKKACGCKDPLHEAISTPDKPTRFIRKGNFVQQRMNGYRKSLASHFGEFRKKIEKNVDFSESNGKFVGTVKNLDKHLTALKEGMNKAAKAYFPVAIDIGSKFVQSHMKNVKESLFEAEVTKKPKLLESMLAWNAGYIADSLMPDMEKRITEAVRNAYDSEDELFKAVNEAVDVFEPRIEQYVGAFWTVEETAVKEAGAGSGLMVNFAGADDESSCDECQEAVDNSPYPIDQAPVPGTLQCLGRCRHALQIIEGDEA